MKTLWLGLKHMGSCLPDLLAEVHVYPDERTVVLRVKAFDSVLIADVVTAQLPEHGVRAFRDDRLGMNTPPAEYRLRIDIDGHLFDAQVVKLVLGNQISVFLEPALEVEAAQDTARAGTALASTSNPDTVTSAEMAKGASIESDPPEHGRRDKPL